MRMPIGRSWVRPSPTCWPEGLEVILWATSGTGRGLQATWVNDSISEIKLTALHHRRAGGRGHGRHVWSLVSPSQVMRRGSRRLSLSGEDCLLVSRPRG